MHPILFDSGSFTLYTYGVLLAAAYLIGLQFTLTRARTRGLDRQRVMDLGIWIIVSALAGAKLMLLVTDFRQYTHSPRALLDLVRSAGVFYGGLIGAVAVALIYIRRHGDHGCVRARHCARTRRRTTGMPDGRLLLRTPDDGPLGDHVSQSGRFADVGHAAWRAAASDADL